METVFRPYLAIARPDHWFKNIFMLPGFAIAFALIRPDIDSELLFKSILAVIATCLVASANYTINEWLDAQTDQHHPDKKNRPSVQGLVKSNWVYLQWLLISITGLFIASSINSLFFYTSLFFLVMGLVYNVPPLRTKDQAYLDVTSEAINNPIRFVLGWCIVIDNHLPPSSILIAYWMGGAYLMAVKRYSEFRQINDPQRARLYRKSFQNYDENSLLLSAMFYALSAAFLLGVFLIKYRVEYLITIPFLAILFVWYLKLGMANNAITQTPEKLYTQKHFICYLIFLSILFIALSIFDIPWLNVLLLPISLSKQ